MKEKNREKKKRLMKIVAINLGVDTFPNPVSPFGALADILDFAGGAVLQAVSKCPMKIVLFLLFYLG